MLKLKDLVIFIREKIQTMAKNKNTGKQVEDELVALLDSIDDDDDENEDDDDDYVDEGYTEQELRKMTKKNLLLVVEEGRARHRRP